MIMEYNSTSGINPIFDSEKNIIGWSIPFSGRKADTNEHINGSVKVTPEQLYSTGLKATQINELIEQCVISMVTPTTTTTTVS